MQIKRRDDFFYVLGRAVLENRTIPRFAPPGSTVLEYTAVTENRPQAGSTDASQQPRFGKLARKFLLLIGSFLQLYVSYYRYQ